MPADRFGAPFPGATYNGFSGGPPPQPDRPSRRRLSRGTLIGGLAAGAVALGLAAGLLLRPDHRTLNEDQMEAKAGPHVPIEVGKPPPPTPMPRPAGKLDVLDTVGAGAAAAAAPRALPAPRAPATPRSDFTPPPTTLQFPVPETTPRVAQAAPPPLVVVPPQASQPPAVRDPCATSRGRAEALVCADPEFAGYDRELNRAYRRAMRSGAVSPEDLRADQRDWLADRESAARRSPEALADTYQQRIDELNRIADDGPG